MTDDDPRTDREILLTIEKKIDDLMPSDNETTNPLIEQLEQIEERIDNQTNAIKALNAQLGTQTRFVKGSGEDSGD